MAAFSRFIERYGARATAEIDVSRKRWREDPRVILRTIAGNLAQEEGGAHREHHNRMAQERQRVADTVEQRAGGGLLGGLRQRIVRRLLRVQRELLPLREHPKWFLVRLFDQLRSLGLEAEEHLLNHERLAAPGDVWFLTFDELIESVDDPTMPLKERVLQRREAHKHHEKLYPPRVLSDEGDSPVVQHTDDDAPDGAMVGSAASAGVVTGIARVIRDPTEEVLHKGEILIAPFTDPGWTPLFVNAAGLVMEVGGMMTHGSVVAREYGIHAVVCVPGVTRTIQTGMRVRVDGTRGWVEILSAEEAGS